MSLKNKQKRKNRRRYPYNPYNDMIKIFGGWGAALCLRPKVHRVSSSVPKKIKGGVLIASNHTSSTDPIILFCVFWYRRLTFLATKEIFVKAINRFFFKNMNCLPVDKEQFSSDTLRVVNDRLKKNMAVVIFPEGKINREEEDILKFKDGTVYIAYRCNKPILPVYIARRDRWWKQNHVIIGEPIYVDKLYTELPRAERIRHISEYLRNYELSLAKYYKTLIKKD